MSAFQLSQVFIDDLWQKIVGYKESPDEATPFHDIFRSGNIPSRPQMSLIVDVAYWTSFATEEGKPVTASLLFREVEHSTDSFPFDAPLHFSAATLVKLGPALENPKSDIGIWSDDAGHLRIWGFTSPPPELIRPDFWVQILGPGRIIILYGGRSIAAVTGNRAEFLDQSKAMCSLIPKIAGQAQSGETRLFNLLRYNALLKIAQQMRVHGRGGTVLVAAENKNWMSSIEAPIKYTGGANFLDADALSSRASTAAGSGAENIDNIVNELSLPQQKDLMKSWGQVQQQCNRIARLTAVDGALVMTYDRFVYCFGAKIVPVNIKGTLAQLRLVNPFTGSGESSGQFSDLSGTRHQSAAQFAYDQPGSIAIAVSQDGNVTFFSRDSQKDTILALQHAELILLHEGLGGSLWNLSLFTELGLFSTEQDSRKGSYLTAVLSWMKSTLQRD